MLNGVLIVNKPKGLTSNDVVMKLKRKFKMREIGHTGTLDPDVEGVLVVCLGKMTKLVPFLMADAKVYTGILTLGAATDTEDASGSVLETTMIEKGQFTTEQLHLGFSALEGKLMQRPPMYSAVKYKGKPLYEYARKGEYVEIPEREITVHTFYSTGEITYQNNQAEIPFYAKVSHGTYIRTLCVQYGEQLGVKAHMKELKRVENGSMNVNESVDLDVLLSSETPEHYLQKGLSVLNTDKWNVVELDSFNETVIYKIMNGAKLALTTPYLGEHTVITKGNNIVSFYEKTDDAYRCVRGIFEGAENGAYSN